MARKKGLTFYQKEKKVNASLVKEILSTFFGCIIAIGLAFVLVYNFGVSTAVIGISMEPSLENGQKVLVDRFTYSFISPRVGDVIAFLPNGDTNSHYYVKRVVASSGDTVQIRNGVLYVNGEISPYNFDKIEDAGIAEDEIKLGSEECFVMGDNCNNSEDSRSANIGVIKKDYIYGKVWFKMGNSTQGMGFVKK